jgi:thymidylate synthase (FAD)
MKVQYINHMGDDLSVVNAARVSFGKHKDLMDKSDTKLIHYLAKHNHKSPFNHAFATFHVKAPIFVARQLQKHEYMPWNEISRRYVDSEPEFYEPVVWRGRSEDKKQGSYGIVDLKTKPTHQYALQTYHNLLSDGVAPEQARMVLPQSMYTEWYWSGSLYAFAKMCSLRLKEDTQLETQVIAEMISIEMSMMFPVSWEALL